MNVSLTPELERLIQEKVESGLYNNQSEVVREALRLLAEHDRLREVHIRHLRKALTESLAQADRGEVVDGAAVVKEMKTYLRSRRAAARKS